MIENAPGPTGAPPPKPPVAAKLAEIQPAEAKPEQAKPADVKTHPAPAEAKPGEKPGGGRIEELRAIITKAAERDQDLQRTLEQLGVEIAKGLGCADEHPVWAEMRAGDHELQETAHFVLADKWLRGELMITVTPEQVFGVGIAVREARDHTHEATLEHERSQTLVIDPPDEKKRAEAHKKFVDRVFAHLESLVRTRVALPPE